ncbi:MAG: hypothetical protein ABEK50_11850, partial [bacterium]
DRLAKSFRRKLAHPVATNLEVTFDGIDVYGMQPAELPNLYHGSPVRLYGRYEGSGKAKVTFKGTVKGHTISRSTTMNFPEKNRMNPEIERMWAWHKVNRLLNQVKSGKKTQSTVDKIVRLGENYSIVTPYTSFIVLENDSEYQRWNIERKNQRRVQRDRAAQKARQKKLAKIRERAIDKLGPTRGRSANKKDDSNKRSSSQSSTNRASNSPRNSSSSSNQ